MQRRDFVAEAVFLMGLATAPHLRASGGGRVETEARRTPGTPVQSRDEDAAVKRAVSDFYSVFYQERDKEKYRSLLTDDYLLLENGELMDAEADIALMPTAEDQYTRKDAFDFRHVAVTGDSAYAVYFLKSDMQDRKQGARSREWLESAILRRVDGRWRVAVLHSTRITKPAP